MKPITVVTRYRPGQFFEKAVHSFGTSDLVERLLAVSMEPVGHRLPAFCSLVDGEIHDRATLMRVINETNTNYLLYLTGDGYASFEPGSIEKQVAAAESTRAGMVYSDFYEVDKQGRVFHALIDYQPGSVRDDFDFGGAVLFATRAVREALKRHGGIPDVRYAGLYDMRLKVSIDHPIYHLRDPLYSVNRVEGQPGDEKLFAYVDPRNAYVQNEMEVVFTEYLKKIGSYVHPGALKRAGQSHEAFPVEASVIIPVRNRFGTVADAVKSALSQETDFPFNVIVVDNHSTDGTTGVLSGLAGRYAGLKHIIPQRTDLGIGGCWNEAIESPLCGRYAIQLDSDDLYSSQGTLQGIVDMFRAGEYAMVIGSYTIVNSRLEEIPPGLIDHREWTDENGHNNALRINGLGAPRAFDTRIIRKTGFLNVSYGEDYAAALNICREYRIGRIYESLYLARRWEGNTDASLTLEAANRNNVFKDKIRTEEILARQKLQAEVDP